MNNLNDIYINTLKSIIQFTNKDKCWIIGSSGLVLLSQGYPNKYYKQFINDDNDDIFKKRDVDVITTSDYDIVKQLKKLGVMRKIKSTNMGYKSLIFKSRMISNISTYEFELGNHRTILGKIVKQFVNNIKVNFTMDIITTLTNNITDILTIWPITETKRNFGVYKNRNEICYTELTEITDVCKKFTDMTLCNTIETLKNMMHIYGSNKLGYTQTGDKIKRKEFDINRLKTDDKLLGKQYRLYDVLNGKSVELAKFINIPCYTYDELNIPDKAEKTCVICCNDIKDQDKKFVILKCEHIYCVGCILPMWISYLIMRYNRINNFSEKGDDEVKSNNQCPMCRTEMFKINDETGEFNDELNVEDYRIQIMNMNIPKVM
jgi:hypothetical protein